MPAANASPLEHVPEQAKDHVPDAVPPEGLPSEAVTHMTPMAKDHVPDWLLSDGFEVPETNGHVPSQQAAPLEHVPEQAKDHVPDSVPPNGLPSEAVTNMAQMAKDQVADWLLSDGFEVPETNGHVPSQQAAPLEHVPEQAKDHVPDSVPPNGLPSEAVTNTAQMAKDHVPDWLLSDEFEFWETNGHGPPQQIELIEQVPAQAEERVPDAVPPEELPSEAAGHVDGMATDHAPDWLLS